jgi:ribosomal protein L15
LGHRNAKLGRGGGLRGGRGEAGVREGDAELRGEVQPQRRVDQLTPH